MFVNVLTTLDVFSGALLGLAVVPQLRLLPDPSSFLSNVLTHHVVVWVPSHPSLAGIPTLLASPFSVVNPSWLALLIGDHL